MWDPVLILTFAMCLVYLIKTFCNIDIRFKMLIYSIVFVFAIFMMFIIWPFYLFRSKIKNGKTTGAFVRYVAKYTDIKWEVRNAAILAEDRAAVIVCNHQSAFDIIGLLIIWDVAGKLSVIAKKELLYFLTLGITFYFSGAIYIDRRDAKNAYNELRKAVNDSLDNKTKIWIYPEGTRNKDLYNLLPFKKGAFVAAVEAQLPIIPIVFSPYHFFTKGKEFLLMQGPIIVDCLTPEPTTGLTVDDVPALIDRVRSRMDAKYKQLSEEVLNYPNTHSKWYPESKPVLEIVN